MLECSVISYPGLYNGCPHRTGWSGKTKIYSLRLSRFLSGSRNKMIQVYIPFYCFHTKVLARCDAVTENFETVLCLILMNIKLGKNWLCEQPIIQA